MDDNKKADEIQKLKAAAFDCIVVIQNAQKHLEGVSARLRELQQPEAEPAPEAES